jgi:hypothetical protein
MIHYDIQGCTASNDSNAVDDVLLELLGKWKEREMLGRDMSGTPNFVLEHLSHHKSFCKALVIAHNHPVLLAFTKRVMMRKFPTQYRLLILYSCTFLMVRTFHPISVGFMCGKFRVLQ